MRCSGDVRSALRRLAVAWLFVLGLFMGAPRSSLAAPLPLPVPVQQGAASTALPEVHYGVPADQPHGNGKPIELPAVPAGFNTVDAGWIHFSYPPSTRGRIEPLIVAADSIRQELAARLGHAVLPNVHVRVARTPGEMTTLAPEGAPYPRYASGVAYSEIGLVLLTLSPSVPSSLYDVGEVFRHELAHVALEDATGGSIRVPHWFNEGLAVHLSGESSLLRLKTLSTATLAGRLVPLGRLERGFPSDATAADLAYAESADVVRFLLRQQDRDRFPALIARVREGQSFVAALRDAYGLDLPTLEYEWREEIAKRYSFWPVLFSGSLVWAGVLLLFVLGFRRKKKKSQETLERWAREEAYAELMRARESLSSAPPRVHIVLPGHEAQVPSSVPSDLPAMPPAPMFDGDVPRVEHDGRWHTLH
jgi:hypothetical protein